MTRSLQALRVSASLVAPGVAQALAGRARAALAFAVAGAVAIVATGVTTALVACTCPLVVGACSFALVGAAAAAHALGAAPRARAAPSAFALAPDDTARWQRRALVGIVAALPFACFAATRTAAVDLYFVPSASMAPTLRAGDTIFVSHLAGVARGSVAVFRGERDRLFVKRIAALAGDRVEVKNGELWLNGEPAPLTIEHHADDPLAGRYYTRTGARAHRVLFQSPYLARPSMRARVVPRGFVFVLGDNRDASDDSRSFGFVPAERVIGRAFALGPNHGEAGTSWENAGSLL